MKFDNNTSKNHIVSRHEIYLQNGKLHTKIYRKETDRQHFLHISHPNQAIRIKPISSNQVDLNNSLKDMKNNFVKQGHHSSLINEHQSS